MVKFEENIFCTSMDATKYYGEFTDGITIGEIMPEIAQELKDLSGEIHVIGFVRDWNIQFSNGSVDKDQWNACKDKISSRKVLQITGYKSWMTNKMIVSVII